MVPWIEGLVALLAAAAALFAFLSFRSGRKLKLETQLTASQLPELLQHEFDRVRQTGEEQGRALRQEIGQSFKGLQEANLDVFRALSDSIKWDIGEFGKRLDSGLRAIDEGSAAIATKLDQEIARLADEASKNRELLRQSIEAKLDSASTRQAGDAKNFREEILASFQSLSSSASGAMLQLGQQQKERLEHVETALSALSEKQERALQTLRQTVENRLEVIRADSANKLEEMRKTVDEKLQITLDSRLGESFTRVVEHLERVHKGIGEMQSLAAGVGDLKKVLTNVRVRGTFGEAQVGMLLEQCLTADQYIKNAQVKPNSQERVEFAIRFPGREGENEVLFPVDAKFPQEDYQRLLAATEVGDPDAIAAASKELENCVKQCAKTIRDKYINPPQTTEFAVLFLPTESLYAEVLRRPGLFEFVQREYRVTLAGPATFSALLNALQMGFRSLAIQKRSSEVWEMLGAIRGEFSKYNTLVDKLSKQLNTAAKSAESLGARTRAVTHKLRNVETLPERKAEALLGPTSLLQGDDGTDNPEPSDND